MTIGQPVATVTTTMTSNEPSRRRIIYSLDIELVQPPGSPPGQSSHLIVRLDRAGMTCSGSNGLPRPPKRRTIDLRVGDHVLCAGQWRTIKGIKAYRENWLTEAQAAACQGGHGYLYRLA
jgi:hypothetical protein